MLVCVKPCFGSIFSVLVCVKPCFGSIFSVSERSTGMLLLMHTCDIHARKGTAAGVDRTMLVAMSASVAVMGCVNAELEGGRDDPRFPGSDRRYANNKPEDLPLTESLKTTVDRFMPLWQDTIAPAVRSGKHVIIAAHGNSLRVSSLCCVMSGRRHAPSPRVAVC